MLSTSTPFTLLCPWTLCSSCSGFQASLSFPLPPSLHLNSTVVFSQRLSFLTVSLPFLFPRLSFIVSLSCSRSLYLSISPSVVIYYSWIWFREEKQNKDASAASRGPTWLCVSGYCWDLHLCSEAVSGWFLLLCAKAEHLTEWKTQYECEEETE